jgi:(hydroxyamino)benzene mutase
MATSARGILSRQGHRLLQLGIALLLVASVEGFFIPRLAAPRLGLSAHSLAGLQSVLFLVLGLVWPRLRLSATLSRLAWWCLVYSGLAILAAYLMAAWWGAGNETMPLAAGVAHGTAVQETAIRVVAYSSAPTGLLAFTLILWGLRVEPSSPEPGGTGRSD